MSKRQRRAQRALEREDGVAPVVEGEGELKGKLEL